MSAMTTTVAFKQFFGNISKLISARLINRIDTDVYHSFTHTEKKKG